MKNGTNRQRSSLISIADVLKTGDRMNTQDSGVVGYLAPGFELAVCALPASHQGGDVFGIIYLGQSRTAVFIGDVAGHDFSSSILATSVIDYFEKNMESLQYPNIFFKKANRDLYRSFCSVGRFFTTALCVLDAENNRVTYSSAGHPPALLLRAEGNSRIETLGEKMLPIGFEKELSFPLQDAHFNTGDRLLMYTDGVSSGRNGDNDEFGIDRIASCAAKSDGSRSSVSSVLAAHDEFCRDTPEMDDRTIICVMRGE